MATRIIFWGLEVTHLETRIFLSRVKHAKVLIRADLLDSKPIATPMVVSTHLRADASLFNSPTTSRSLVEALQCLTITRPDITHAVNPISQIHSCTTRSPFSSRKKNYPIC